LERLPLSGVTPATRRAFPGAAEIQGSPRRRLSPGRTFYRREADDATCALAAIGYLFRERSMKSKSVASGEERTFVLILDQGEEAFKAITDFADQQSISGASVSAVGAFAEARVGWFDLSAKTYRPIGVSEQCEVLSLLGDVAEGDDGKASLHLHAVLGLRDGSVRGGHFLSGSVRPTLEVTIRETVAHLRRKKRPDLGIALISI
jgi:predicted DNA-binding protein with PD1-like motif